MVTPLGNYYSFKIFHLRKINLNLNSLLFKHHFGEAETTLAQRHHQPQAKKKPSLNFFKDGINRGSTLIAAREKRTASQYELYGTPARALFKETSLKIEGTHVIFEDYDNICYEPELTLNIIEGDRFKEQGNPNWYFELTGSMNQVSNEFYGTPARALFTQNR